MVTRINDLNLKYRESVMDTEIKTVRKLSIFHPVLDPIANQAPKSKEWFPNPDILVSIQSAENQKDTHQYQKHRPRTYLSIGSQE